MQQHTRLAHAKAIFATWWSLVYGTLWGLICSADVIVDHYASPSFKAWWDAQWISAKFGWRAFLAGLGVITVLFVCEKSFRLVQTAQKEADAARAEAREAITGSDGPDVVLDWESSDSNNDVVKLRNIGKGTAFRVILKDFSWPELSFTAPVEVNNIHPNEPEMARDVYYFEKLPSGASSVGRLNMDLRSGRYKDRSPLRVKLRFSDTHGAEFERDFILEPGRGWGPHVLVTPGRLKKTRSSPDSSTRNEREVRHLENIRASVVQPILQWTYEVLALLEGRGANNLVAVRQVDDPAENPKPFYISEIIVPANTLSELLLADARQNHFPSQLSKYDSAARKFHQFFADVAEFARTCCDELEKETTLPRPKFNDRSEDCFDIESFVQACIRCIPHGTKIHWHTQPGMTQGRVTAWFHGTGAAIAHNTEANLKEWIPRDIEIVTERWSESGLAPRLKSLREEFESVKSEMLEVELFETLPGTCKYLG
ncbi:MAG: hypothetical protein WA581_07675 [Candidatus Acidiferrales bacterium]